MTVEMSILNLHKMDASQDKLVHLVGEEIRISIASTTTLGRGILTELTSEKSILSYKNGFN